MMPPKIDLSALFAVIKWLAIIQVALLVTIVWLALK